MPAVPNLLSPPGDPERKAGYKKKSRKWRNLFRRGQSEIGASRWSEAIETFQSLHLIDARYARSHYLLGLALLAKGRRDEAEKELILANLHDRRGNRANDEIMEVLVEACHRRKAAVLNLREQFYSRVMNEFDPPLQEPRSHLFLDHCHPSQKGHAMIADAITEFLWQNLDR